MVRKMEITHKYRIDDNHLTTGLVFLVIYLIVGYIGMMGGISKGYHEFSLGIIMMLLIWICGIRIEHKVKT